MNARFPGNRLEQYMNTARVSVCLAIVLTWTLASPVLAQYEPGQTSLRPDSPDTVDRFDHRNFQLRGDFGDGVGYAKGYQTFGVFQPFIVEPDEFIFFANPRGIVTYLGDLSANVGVGTRYYNPDNDRIWGASFWYDHDNNNANRYDQFGVSLESLGQYFDMRANAYILSNDNPDVLGSFFTGQNVFFQNFIGIGRATLVNTPLNGGDFEAGGALPGIGDIGLRTYAGGYYYQGENTGAVYGVRARAEALITQDFWAQVAVTHDRLFGTNVTAALTWYYGSGQAPRWFQRIPTNYRLYQQVERQYRIAVFENTLRDTVPALRAGGTGGSGGPVGTPIFVVHVDNTAPAGGDGTVEHPYNTLPTSTPPNVDIVFVNRGNGTSSGYDNGITLNDYQRFLGQGVQHTFTSTTGTFVLPGYVAGPLPQITNPAGDVVRLANFNEVSGFNIANAGRHGIYGLGVNSFNINNVNITDSGTLVPTPVGAGIQLDNAQGDGYLFASTLVNNAAEGMRIDNVGTTLKLRVNNVSSNGNLTGFSLNGTGGSVWDVAMSDVNSSSNRHDGMAITLDGGSSFSGVFDRITSNNNNNPVVDLNFGNGFAMNIDSSNAAVRIEHSTFNSNGLNGLSFVATGGSNLGIELVNNNQTISNNLLNGVFVDGTDSNIDLLLKNNVIVGNGNIGVNLQATDGSFDLFAGGYGTEDQNGNGVLDPGEDANGNGVIDREGNVIDNNRGAGLAYTLRDAAVGTIDIRGNIITRTLNDTFNSPIYNGQGIDIRLDGSTNSSDATATLTAGIIDRNTIGSRTDASLGNAGDGISVFADQRTTLSALTVGNTDGPNGNGNVVARNGGDGIHFFRRNEAVVDNVIIQDNIVERNAGNGMNIEAHATQNDVNDYHIQGNLITNNTLNGVRFLLEADAAISANMFDNIIRFNGLNGIQDNDIVNSPLDPRFLTGTWQRNVISNNTLDGIEINGATNNLLVGSFINQPDGNLINDNGNDGIEINGSGSISIARNEIARNLAGGIDINAATSNLITITQNYIHNNLNTNGDGDGIEILSAGPGFVAVTANLNTIRDNSGRGVDILNRASGAGSAVAGQAFITLDQNVIAGNRLEGIYVINTASGTQSQSVPSTDALAADGNIFAAPRLTLEVTNNRVEGNGLGSGFSATGLVLRVGTSDGGYSYFDDGGFFGEGFGGVGATITGNTFSGNLGDDIYFDSFTSTVNPGDTAGEWSDTVFRIDFFRGDPLARLDLTFLNNTFESANVNNSRGSFNSETGASAFYNNAEDDFKSRTIRNSVDTGPFANGSRERNAQRLAARFTLNPQVPTPPPPNGGADSGDFLYSGIGQSTFRLLGVAAPGNVGIFNPTGNVGTYVNGGFFVDDFYQNRFDANGLFNAGAGADAMPYGWNVNGGDPRPQ